MMEQKSKDNRTVLANIHTLINWAEKARKNIWSAFRDGMIESWKREMFGDPIDDRIDSLQKKFITNQVFGATKGVAPDRDMGRRMAFATADVSELPFAEKVKELEGKALARGGLKKWEAEELAGVRMALARRPDMSPERMQQRFQEMLERYESESDKIRDSTLLGESILTYMKQLARSLARSGGWGKGADEEYLERSGHGVVNRDLDYDRQKTRGGSPARATPPRLRTKAEIGQEGGKSPDAEAEKAAQRQALAAKKIDPTTVKPAAKRPPVPTEYVPGGLGHIKGHDPEGIEATSRGRGYWEEGGGSDELSAWLEQQRAERDEELRELGFDPDRFYGDVGDLPTRDGGKISEDVDLALSIAKRMAEDT
jgi:hypothetical protein